MQGKSILNNQHFDGHKLIRILLTFHVEQIFFPVSFLTPIHILLKLIVAAIYPLGVFSRKNGHIFCSDGNCFVFIEFNLFAARGARPEKRGFYSQHLEVIGIFLLEA